MKYLFATNQTQGTRKSDFNWANENEPVRFGLECCGEPVDGHCGCRRSMVGMYSANSTTTMRVMRIDEPEKEKLIEDLHQSLMKSWGVPDEDAGKMAREEVEDIIMMCTDTPENIIMERRGDRLQSRRRARLYS